MDPNPPSRKRKHREVQTCQTCRRRKLKVLSVRSPSKSYKLIILLIISAIMYNQCVRGVDRQVLPLPAPTIIQLQTMRQSNLQQSQALSLLKRLQLLRKISGTLTCPQQ